jgi:hypothetical protein
MLPSFVVASRRRACMIVPLINGMMRLLQWFVSQNIIAAFCLLWMPFFRSVVETDVLIFISASYAFKSIDWVSTTMHAVEFTTLTMKASYTLSASVSLVCAVFFMKIK